MRKTNNNCNFFVSIILNVILNIEWSIPAWILLVCHFVFDISIIWFVGALALWLFIMIIFNCFLKFSSKCSNEPDIKKENKNPYSTKDYKDLNK